MPSIALSNMVEELDLFSCSYVNASIRWHALTLIGDGFICRIRKQGSINRNKPRDSVAYFCLWSVWE